MGNNTTSQRVSIVQNSRNDFGSRNDTDSGSDDNSPTDKSTFSFKDIEPRLSIARRSSSFLSPINIKRKTIVDKVSSSIVSAGPKLAWNYTSNGDDWIFKECNGYLKQSPINIVTSEVVPFNGPPISIKFHNRITHFHIVDNGVTFVTDLTKVSDAIATLSGPDVDGQKNKYELLQFHFHSPAEHTIDSKKYDLELHFVFQYKGEAGDGPSNYLSVMGLIFKVVPEITADMHDGRFIREFKCDNLGLDLTLNFYHLHSIFKESEYYAYKGSLTAVPCLEIVNWYLHKDVFYITEKELEPFNTRWVLNKHFSNGCGNNRHVQPLQDRKIFKMTSPKDERVLPKSHVLKSGEKIPFMGFSVFNEQIIDTHHFQSALKHGFLHIQTGYFNTDEINLGETLKMVIEGGTFKREDLFISAVYEVSDRLEKNVMRTLEDLGVEFFDLILLEKPKERDLDPEFINDTVRRVANCWKTLNEFKTKGITKIIGVSNYDTALLNELLCFAETGPSVNLIDFHPLFQQRDVMNICKKHNIAVMANGFSLPKFRQEIQSKEKKLEQLIEIAKSHNKNVRQILLNWMTTRGVIPVLRPDDFHYLKESFGFTDFELTPEQIETISNLHKEQTKSYLHSALNEI
jgi:alcohol dehydrogenase (NADP+)